MRRKLFTAIVSTGLLATIHNGAAHASEKQYTVQSGDTLWKISQSNHISVQDITTWNQLSSNTIHIGQKLLITPPEIQKESTYTVKSGEFLSLIAKKFNMSVLELKQLNNLTTHILHVGQVIKLTGVKATEETAVTVKTADLSNLKLNADALITEAKKYIGVPYVWGGSSTSGFDCSGFINCVFAKQGITIPRTVAAIWDDTKTVSTPEKGDIVFFETASGPSHAGIYIGNNQFIHASSSKGIMISDLNNVYWKPKYLGAKRVN